ncbi:MAG: ankyrin repeat domain-containing protein [Pararhodobacter sp.]|nr:ankyrin repeat domain-containing protein [Pararhodobacter sp.]
MLVGYKLHSFILAQVFAGILLSSLVSGAVQASESAEAVEDISCSDWGSRVFFQFAERPLVESCLQNGAEILARNDAGETPLHLAAAYATDPAIVRLLLASGAESNAKRRDLWQPIHMAAAYSSRQEVIVSLVLSGVDADERVERQGRRRGTTPLMLALEHNRPHEIISILIAMGADPQRYWNDQGRRPIHIAARDASDRSIIDLLVASGADVGARDDQHWHPIHLAASRNANNFEVNRALLEHSADPDVTNREDVTALHLGAAHASVEVFELLFAASDEPCATDSEGRTALMIAEEFNETLDRTQVFWELHEACAGQ